MGVGSRRTKKQTVSGGIGGHNKSGHLEAWLNQLHASYELNGLPPPRLIIECSYRLTVRTLVFHAGNRGSIPRASTKTWGIV